MTERRATRPGAMLVVFLALWQGDRPAGAATSEAPPPDSPATSSAGSPGSPSAEVEGTSFTAPPALPSGEARWTCPPCGCAGDTLRFAASGPCPHCGMAMILVGSGKRVAVLVYDGVEPLDFIGPVEVFAADHGHFEVFTVAPREGTITTGIGALVVTPAHTFADCPPAEILVVPGGGTGPISRDPEALRFIRRRAEESEVVLSVCSGSFILGAAGLLDGLTVTAHRGDLDELRRAVPGAKVVDARFVDNGRIVTAGGVSSGIDAALHVLGRLHGRETRDRVAEYLQHRPEPGTVVDH